MSYQLCSLEDVPFAEVHACFAAAFADYAVKSVLMDQEALLRRARKNDWAPNCSLGVRADGKLIAVSLTGIDQVGGERRGYDICTGVVPGHRGKGLAGMIMDEIIPRLGRAGATALQLEVLQNNAAAVRAYNKAGFTTTRSLVSHAGIIGDVVHEIEQVNIRPIALPDLLRLSPQMDFEPSFEQRDAALLHLGDDLVVLGAFDDGRCGAALAFDPKTAWMMRLVTHRQFRRRGLARALLRGLAGRLQRDAVVKAVNIDERDQASRALMSACGLQESIRQWEMRLAFAP